MNKIRDRAVTLAERKRTEVNIVKNVRGRKGCAESSERKRTGAQVATEKTRKATRSSPRRRNARTGDDREGEETKRAMSHIVKYARTKWADASREQKRRGDEAKPPRAARGPSTLATKEKCGKAGEASVPSRDEDIYILTKGEFPGRLQW